MLTTPSGYKSYRHGIGNIQLEGLVHVYFIPQKIIITIVRNHDEPIKN